MRNFVFKMMDFAAPWKRRITPGCMAYARTSPSAFSIATPPDPERENTSNLRSNLISRDASDRSECFLRLQQVLGGFVNCAARVRGCWRHEQVYF